MSLYPTLNSSYCYVPSWLRNGNAIERHHQWSEHLNVCAFEQNEEDFELCYDQHEDINEHSEDINEHRYAFNEQSEDINEHSEDINERSEGVYVFDYPDEPLEPLYDPLPDYTSYSRNSLESANSGNCWFNEEPYEQSPPSYNDIDEPSYNDIDEEYNDIDEEYNRQLLLIDEEYNRELMLIDEEITNDTSAIIVVDESGDEVNSLLHTIAKKKITRIAMQLYIKAINIMPSAVLVIDNESRYGHYVIEYLFMKTYKDIGELSSYTFKDDYNICTNRQYLIMYTLKEILNMIITAKTANDTDTLKDIRKDIRDMFDTHFRNRLLRKYINTKMNNYEIAIITQLDELYDIIDT